MLKSPTRLRNVALNVRQLELYRMVKKMGEQGITTADYASMKSISPQNASNKLSTLHTKGYFKRHEQLQDSGGVEFVYHAIIF